DRARQLPADVHRRGPVQEGRARSRQAAQDARRLAGGHEEADGPRRQGRADAGRVRASAQGPPRRHQRQVLAVRARARRAHAVAGARQGDGIRERRRDGGGAHVLRGPRAQAQGGEPRVSHAGGRVRPEARGDDLPRVVVLRLGQEECAGRELQGLRAAVREDVPGCRESLPVDEHDRKEQPEQAGRVGLHPVHQQRQGRPRAAPGAGHPAGVDRQPRVGVREAVRNTLSLLLMSVPATVVLGLSVALGLHRIRSLRWRSAWTAMYFLPFSVSLVAAALIWQWMYDPLYGFLNHLLGRVGLPPLKWLQSLEMVRPSLAIVNVWVRLGFDTIIFLAALQAIPTDYYEAASFYGAGPVRALRHVTLPLLNPQIVMVTMLELIFNFKVFDTVYATTQGGPAGASQTVIMLLYDTAFKYFRLGDASVMAVFVFATLLLVTLLQWRLFRRRIEY